MDRREALKKIGVGGAAVAGASVVMSSPAFAYDLPNTVVDSVVSFNPQAQIVGVRILSNASAKCNASALTTPNARIDSRTITATSVAMETGFQWRANNNLVGTATNLNVGASVTSPADTSEVPPPATWAECAKS